MKLVCGLLLLVLVSSISAVKMRKRPQPANTKAKAYWYDNLCIDNPDFDRFYHDDCEQYYQCYEDGTWSIEWCPEGTIFDFDLLECYEDGVCHNNVPADIDPRCPLVSNDLIFIGGITCEDYYICNNGIPIPMSCRKGMHWNSAMRYCDTPGKAGCDVGSFRKIQTQYFENFFHSKQQ